MQLGDAVDFGNLAKCRKKVKYKNSACPFEGKGLARWERKSGIFVEEFVVSREVEARQCALSAVFCAADP